jgi:hypothetical protein
MTEKKHLVFFCVYFDWRSGEVYPFTSIYGTYSGFTHSGWPSDMKGNFEHTKYRHGPFNLGLAFLVGRLQTF